MNNTETKTFKDVYGDHTGEIYKGDLYLFLKNIKKIYKNTRDFKKFKLLKDFIGLGN